jgi:Mg/Co/Ni transporter MgtE
MSHERRIDMANILDLFEENDRKELQDKFKEIIVEQFTEELGQEYLVNAGDVADVIKDALEKIINECIREMDKEIRSNVKQAITNCFKELG